MKFKPFKFIGLFILFGGFLPVLIKDIVYSLPMTPLWILYGVSMLLLGCLFLSLEED